jgi:hypothetical protein
MKCNTRLIGGYYTTFNLRATLCGTHAHIIYESPIIPQDA